MTSAAKNTKEVRIRRTDWAWLEEMRKKMVMSDGTNRNMSDVLHSVIVNARALVDDDMELVQDG